MKNMSTTILIFAISIVVVANIGPILAAVTINLNNDRNSLETHMVELATSSTFRGNLKIKWKGLSTSMDADNYCKEAVQDQGLVAGSMTVLKDIVFVHIAQRKFAAEVLECKSSSDSQVVAQITKDDFNTCALVFKEKKLAHQACGLPERV